MSDLMKAVWLGVVLAAMAASSGCGSSPPGDPQITTVTRVVPGPPVPQGPHAVVITLLNSGTQDSSLGATYGVTENATVNILSVVLRTQGSTLQSGTGVGVDFGDGNQCYYSGDVNASEVFALMQCTGGLTAGSSVNLVVGQVITLWSYSHVNSPDSVVELVLNGQSN